MSDIVLDRMVFDHLEQQAARSDEAAYLRTQVQLLTDEVNRLLLTSSERDAIQWAADTLCVGWHDLRPDDKAKSRSAVGALRELLARLRGE